MAKKVLLAVAHDGFQPLEYGAPKEILEAAGVEVVTASDVSGTASAAYDGPPTKVDIVLADARAEDYDGVFFVGGPGASEFLENEGAYHLAREAARAGKALGAICYSTRVLAHAGVLTGKRVTGWDGDGELGRILEVSGAQYVREPVVVDDKLVTATGPKFAAEWAKKILEIL